MTSSPFLLQASKDVAQFPIAAKVAELLIQSILKDNYVELTEEGIGLAKMALETSDLWDENDPGQDFRMGRENRSMVVQLNLVT
ncbi:hypothetical protein ACSQ67_024968 [Phaseolus vulgaris]